MRGLIPALPGIVVLAIAVVGIGGALELPIGTPTAPDAGFVPLIESALLAIGGAILAVQGFRRRPQEAAAASRASAQRSIVPLVLALFGYALLLPIAGFALATFLFAWAAIASWRSYRPLVAAAYALAFAAVAYLVFAVALRMSLPAGWW